MSKKKDLKAAKLTLEELEAKAKKHFAKRRSVSDDLREAFPPDSELDEPDEEPVASAPEDESEAEPELEPKSELEPEAELDSIGEPEPESELDSVPESKPEAEPVDSTDSPETAADARAIASSYREQFEAQVAKYEKSLNEARAKVEAMEAKAEALEKAEAEERARVAAAEAEAKARVEAEAKAKAEAREKAELEANTRYEVDYPFTVDGVTYHTTRSLVASAYIPQSAIVASPSLWIKGEWVRALTPAEAKEHGFLS